MNVAAPGGLAIKFRAFLKPETFLRRCGSALFLPRLVFTCFIAAPVASRGSPIILSPSSYQKTIEQFNRGDAELITNTVPNARAWEWMKTKHSLVRLFR